MILGLAAAQTPPVAPETDAADSIDEILLRRTLYGALRVEELTEAQCAEMLDAAARRVERQQARIERTRTHVEAGLFARNTLRPLEEELTARRKALQWAEERAALLRELAAAARAEAELAQVEPAGPAPVVERFTGRGLFSPSQWRIVAAAFEKQFRRVLPVTANGATAVHRLLGFDHRGRIDIGLDPDQPEGVWLRQYLAQEQIPYYAFRARVRGKSTAPHIHIGPPSPRLAVAD